MVNGGSKRIRARRPGPPRRGRIVDPEFLAWMAEIFICAVAQFAPEHADECRAPMTTHHVRDHGSPKKDRKAVRLCVAHHLHDFGPYSIERLGKEKFEQHTGLSILALIEYYNEAYDRIGIDHPTV